MPPPTRPDLSEIHFSIRELATQLNNLQRDNEKLINDRFSTLMKQVEKNEVLIRETEDRLQLLPGELEKVLRDLIAREFSQERSLEMARKILDGLRQGMHLFLGGTLSRPNPQQPPADSGIVPASAFPARPPNPYTLAAKKEEDAEGEIEPSTPLPTQKKRDITASFSVDKSGKIDITVDKNSRIAFYGGIVAAVAALGWLAQLIYNVVHK
jgi:hypothetical protein